MNTTLSTQVDELHHQPHPPEHQPAARRVRFADRVALHVGLALITWSRRPAKAAHQPDRDELRARHARSLERAKREWQAERSARLTLPPR